MFYVIEINERKVFVHFTTAYFNYIIQSNFVISNLKNFEMSKDSKY